MKTILACALLLLSTSAFAQSEKAFQVQSSITEAPCEAWVKQADGSWLQAPNTVIVLPGNNKMMGNRFKGGGEAAVLDRKCGK